LQPLTSSGDVTLTGGALFLAVTAATNGVQSITNGVNPLGGLWPSPHLRIQPSVRPHRTVALAHLGPVVLLATNH
jgi:hypothetical protein